MYNGHHFDILGRSEHFNHDQPSICKHKIILFSVHLSGYFVSLNRIIRSIGAAEVMLHIRFAEYDIYAFDHDNGSDYLLLS